MINRRDFAKRAAAIALLPLGLVGKKSMAAGSTVNPAVSTETQSVMTLTYNGLVINVAVASISAASLPLKQDEFDIPFGTTGTVIQGRGYADRDACREISRSHRDTGIARGDYKAIFDACPEHIEHYLDPDHCRGSAVTEFLNHKDGKLSYSFPVTSDPLSFIATPIDVRAMGVGGNGDVFVWFKYLIA